MSLCTPLPNGVGLGHCSSDLQTMLQLHPSYMPPSCTPLEHCLTSCSVCGSMLLASKLCIFLHASSSNSPPPFDSSSSSAGQHTPAQCKHCIVEAFCTDDRQHTKSCCHQRRKAPLSYAQHPGHLPAQMHMTKSSILQATVRWANRGRLQANS